MLVTVNLRPVKLAKSAGRLEGTFEDACAVPRQFHTTRLTLAEEIASFLPRPLFGGSRSPTGVWRVTDKIGSGSGICTPRPLRYERNGLLLPYPADLINWTGSAACVRT